MPRTFKPKTCEHCGVSYTHSRRDPYCPRCSHLFNAYDAYRARTLNSFIEVHYGPRRYEAMLRRAEERLAKQWTERGFNLWSGDSLRLNAEHHLRDRVAKKASFLTFDQFKTTPEARPLTKHLVKRPARQEPAMVESVH